MSIGKPVNSGKPASAPVRRRFLVTTEPRDRGSASLWVVAGGVLVLLVALVAVLRGTAVMARERAEAAADLAALAAADGIGVDGSSAGLCARARPIATANEAHLVGCAVRLAADGRTGTVDVTVAVRVRLIAVGAVVVHAHARAGRLDWSAEPGPVATRAARGRAATARLAGSPGAGRRPGPTVRGRMPVCEVVCTARPVRDVWHDWSAAG